MTEIHSAQRPRLGLIEWAARMAKLYEGFAELMHDTADHMVPIDPGLAERFYLAADLTRIEVINLRRIIRLQALANCIVLVIGLGLGIVLGFVI